MVGKVGGEWHFPPIQWNDAENWRKKNPAPHCLSIMSLEHWPPVKLHLDALIYLSVNRKRGGRGGGAIGASSQSSLLSQMHNSVFLSQQPLLRRVLHPQPCGQQSANIKRAQNPLCCSSRLSGFTNSLVWFIQHVHPWHETQTPVDKLGNIIVLVRIQPQNLAEQVCRHHCGLSSDTGVA